MSSNLNRFIGWSGTQLLAFCGLPAAIQVIQQGHAEGYSGTFIGMWGIGELLCLIYVYNRYKDWPLLVNYLLNLTFLSVIVYYMI